MKKAVRILLLAGCILLLIWAGYTREWKLLVMQNGLPTLINRYPKPPTGDYSMQLQGIFSFNPSPKLQSSILFGILFTALASAIIGLLTESRKFAALTAALYCGLLFLCFVLLQLGVTGVDYRLSIGLSHYLEDIILSPFVVMVLVVLLKMNGSLKTLKS
jgi:hypothetical protein